MSAEETIAVPAFDAVVEKRLGGEYVASLRHQPGVREVGWTEAQALGKLAITVAAAAEGKGDE